MMIPLAIGTITQQTPVLEEGLTGDRRATAGSTGTAWLGEEGVMTATQATLGLGQSPGVTQAVVRP